MRRRCFSAPSSPSPTLPSASGPGRLCRALAIDRRLNGHDLRKGELVVAEPVRPSPLEIVARPRVGVDYAGEWAGKPLRFYIAGNPFISKSLIAEPGGTPCGSDSSVDGTLADLRSGARAHPRADARRGRRRRAGGDDRRV